MNNKIKHHDSILDVIRCMAIWMIVFYHFTSAYNTDSFLFSYRNGDWGSVGTAIFFLLSGYCISLTDYKFQTGKQVLYFYKKRFLSLFPLMWLTFLIAYVCRGILYGNFLYGGAPVKLLLTFAGVDGYLAFLGIPTYFLVGEWFTAIIIALYLLYPLLKWLFRHLKVVTTLVLIGLYVANIILTDGFLIPDASIFTGLLMFWVGMLLHFYRDGCRRHRWPLLIAAVVLGIMLLVVPLPYYRYLLPWENLLSIVIFLFLLLALDVLNRIPEKGRNALQYQSKISFAIYLCHHTILVLVPDFLQRQGVSENSIGVSFLVTILVIELAAIILYEIHRKLSVLWNHQQSRP